MNITLIKICTGCYSTTNPPISESSELAMKVTEGEACIVERNSFNSDFTEKEYRMTARQYDEIVSLFNELKIPEVIKNLNEQNMPCFPMQTGGYRNHSFSFTIDGETTLSNRVNSEIDTLMRKLREMISECGEPIKVSEHKDPDAPRPGGFAFIGAMPPAAEANNAAHSENEWVCANCGFQFNKGKFCVECGAKR